MKDNNPIATLCAAFGPTFMVLGLAKTTGTTGDIVIAILGGLATTYAMLVNGDHRKHMDFKGKKYL
jgi:hypothetical protein